MIAMVTGATGLLGSNLTQLLVSQGHTVKALVRSPAKAQTILGHLPNVKIIPGDMERVAEMAPHLAGCDLLFHTAAYFRESYGLGNHWPRLQRINVQGTIELLEAAERAGVGKVIYVSSSGCLGLRPDGLPSDETTPPDRLTFNTLYFKSKLRAEQAIDQFLARHTLPVVLIQPGTMFGPQDSGPTEPGKLVLDHLHRRQPALLSGGMPVVDARDVAAAMVAAVDRGESGQRYLVGGVSYSMAHLGRTLAAVSGVPAPKLRLPGMMMRIGAWVSTWVGRITRRPPAIPIDGVTFILANIAYDSRKAQAQLGITFRPLEDTLADMVAWFRRQGMAPAARSS